MEERTKETKLLLSKETVKLGEMREKIDEF